MVAARRTDPLGRMRRTRPTRTIPPASARQRLGSTPRPVRTSPSTMTTCCPETAVRWVIETVRMFWRRSAGRAWSSPRASPGTRARAPASSPPAQRPGVLPPAWPVARVSPSLILPTAPSTPRGSPVLVGALPRPRIAASDAPGSGARSRPRAVTREPRGISSQDASPRTRMRRPEGTPSMLTSSRAVRMVVARAEAVARGCSLMVPSMVTARPDSTASVVGSRARAHWPAEATARTAAATRQARRAPAAMGPALAAPALPGRGSWRCRGGR